MKPTKPASNILWSQFYWEWNNESLFSKSDHVSTVLPRKLYICKRKGKMSMGLQSLCKGHIIGTLRAIDWLCEWDGVSDPNLYLYLFYWCCTQSWKIHLSSLRVTFLFCKRETKISTPFFPSQGRKLIRIKMGQLLELCGEKYEQFLINSYREGYYY